MADDKAPKPEGLAEQRELAIPGYWGSNLLLYNDISRLMLRMHRNVAAHMDAHKRLMERLQTVFQAEQTMVLELARMIDEATAQAARKSNEERPAFGAESFDRVFAQAAKVMEASGKMLGDIQLEALTLLKHYIDQPSTEKPPGETK